MNGAPLTESAISIIETCGYLCAFPQPHPKHCYDSTQGHVSTNPQIEDMQDIGFANVWGSTPRNLKQRRP